MDDSITYQYEASGPPSFLRQEESAAAPASGGRAPRTPGDGWLLRATCLLAMIAIPRLASAATNNAARQPARCERVTDTVEQAMAALQNDLDLEAAQQTVSAAARQNPGCARIEYTLAALYGWLERWQEAAQCYERGARTGGETAGWARAQAAVSRLRIQQRRGSAQDYVAKREAELLGALRSALWQKDTLTLALLAQSAQRLETKNVQLLTLAGVGYWAGQHFLRAVHCLQEALALAPAAEKAQVAGYLEACQKEQRFYMLWLEGHRAATEGREGAAASMLFEVWQQRPSDHALGLEAAAALIAAGKRTDAASVLNAVAKSGIPEYRQEAAMQQLTLQTLKERAQAAEQARADRSHAQLGQEFAKLRTGLDEAINRSLQFGDNTVAEAERREREIRDCEQAIQQYEELAESSEQTANQSEAAANDLARTAATAGKSWGVALGSIGASIEAAGSVAMRTLAADYRRKAESCRERIQRLRQGLD